MRCEQLRELTDEYLDGTLTDEGKQEVDHHLRSCSQCAKFMEEERKILGILSDMEEEELPPGFEQRLHHKLQQAASQIKIKFPKTLWVERPWLKWGTALAAVFVLAFSVYVIWPFKSMKDSPTKETPDFQMHSANGNGAMYDLAPSEADLELAQEDIGSLVEEASPADEIISAVELPAEILLYISEMGVSNEDIQKEIVLIAAEFQFDVLETQSNKIILKKNDKVERDEFFERLSQLGRIELSSWKVRENTLTIQVINE